MNGRDRMCILETDRLMMRRFREEDWRELYAYLSLPEVVKYEPYDVFTEDGCRELAARRADDPAFWAVCLKDTGALIGNVFFQQQEPRELGTWVIGYVFNPAYQGRGYATESCRRVMAYGFSERNAHRVVAMCNPENPASWRLLERLHMRREGHLQENIFFKRDAQGNAVWVDTYEYAILSDEWLRLPMAMRSGV